MRLSAKRFVLFISFFIFHAYAFADQLIVEPEMGRAPILNAISRADHSIDLVMYGFTDQPLLDALIQKRLQGRSIHVLLEQEPYRAQDENVKTIKALKKYNIKWRGDVPPFPLIHQKTLILDSKKAIVMTFNFTRSAFQKQRNFGLIIDDPNIVREIKDTFSADWHHIAFSPQAKSLIWSPDNARKKMLTLINQAHHSINIYAQSINDFKTIGALAMAAKKGVQVQLLTSNHLRTKQEEYLTRAGVSINYSHELIIHAKVIMIDDQKALIGSINFTQHSLDKNRELAVVTEDKTVLSQLQKTFNADLKKAKKTNQSLLSHMGINESSLIHLLKRINRALIAAAID